VLLNWILPDVSGVDLCRRLCAQTETQNLRVILVSDHVGDRNAIEGLNAAADDYMVKPLSLAELMARIRALLRRAPVSPGERRLRWREITMDLTAFRVTRDGREIHLGPIEFRLLKFLLQNPKRVFSRQEIIDAVWDRDVHVQPRNVDVQVRRLRRSMNRDGEPDIIRTIRMAGYALEIE
jgi:two-component system, OmpR family, phosphate regulon response regulator PhoB